MMMQGSHTTTLATAYLAMLLVPVQVALADGSNNNIQKRHVQMVTPKPYVGAEYGPTNPLNPDGSDYPCKVPKGEKFQVDGSPTDMVIGEDQVVSFDGWAVHGGGSCQFALTEGLDPTPDSAWKVIHSIEGGCPKANVAGNLAVGQEPDNYTFSVPDGFAPGDYTFAWTWVNRIAGSPEFYMNCAPITVKAAGGSTARVRERRAGWGAPGRRAAETSYPDLFLANIGSAGDGCDTSEALAKQLAIEYPYPGDSVSYPDGTDNLFKQPCDGNPRNSNGSVASGGGGSASSASGKTGGGASSTDSASGATATGSPSMVGSAAASISTAASSSSSASSLSSYPQSSAPVVASATASASGTSSTASSSSSSCTDGHLKCVGGTQFSTCTGGVWTAPQDLASNATCKEEGESEGLDITNSS